MWQQRISRELDGDLLYGIADVIRRDTIFDIKRVYQYDPGKYEGSIQHLIYMYATGITNFEYVVSDGHEVYAEAYRWGAKSLETLRERIADMKGSLLADDEMSLAFRTHWIAKKDAGLETSEAAQTNRETEILRSFEDVRNRNINALRRDMVP
jgi:hypothetical protein